MSEDDSFERCKKDDEIIRQRTLARFPKPGARLRYCGTHTFWFTDVIANAERELQVGMTYTLNSIELASSWAKITLNETRDVPYSLGFFVEVPPVTPEQRAMEWYRGSDDFRSSITPSQSATVERLLARGYQFEFAWPDMNRFPEEIHMLVLLKAPAENGREVATIVSEDGLVNGSSLHEYLSGDDRIYSDEVFPKDA